MGTPPSDEDLAAQAKPLAGKPLNVPVAEIPLPPEHLVDELDNQGASAGSAAVEEEAGEVATLDFFGDELPTWTHPLKYKFRWQGTPVKDITVRQLTTAEVGETFNKARKAGRMPELMEVYAQMTGLPAKVLRALPAEDGDPVTEKCWDFLPPSLRPESVSEPDPKTP